VEAYETWWSLSLASEGEELVTPSEHLNGAKQAGIEAIRWFDRIARQARILYKPFMHEGSSFSSDWESIPVSAASTRLILEASSDAAGVSMKESPAWTMHAVPVLVP
jgi:hypothetical protein